jgi:hypothetical protein
VSWTAPEVTRIDEPFTGPERGILDGFPMHALTTYERSRYRRELEHALKELPEHAPVRELLHGKLAEVLAEEDSRAKIADLTR